MLFEAGTEPRANADKHRRPKLLTDLSIEQLGGRDHIQQTWVQHAGEYGRNIQD